MIIDTTNYYFLYFVIHVSCNDLELLQNIWFRLIGDKGLDVRVNFMTVSNFCLTQHT